MCCSCRLYCVTCTAGCAADPQITPVLMPTCKWCVCFWTLLHQTRHFRYTTFVRLGLHMGKCCLGLVLQCLPATGSLWCMLQALSAPSFSSCESLPSLAVKYKVHSQVPAIAEAGCTGCQFITGCTLEVCDVCLACCCRVVAGQWLGPWVLCKALEAAVAAAPPQLCLAVHVVCDPGGGAPSISMHR